MGLLLKDKGIAFSGFEGQLLFEGKPAAGATLKRTWDVFNDKGEDETRTDDNGRFQFESVEVKFRTPAFAPFDFLSKQNVQVTYNDSRYRGWFGGKIEKESFAEFNGQPRNLTCELTEETRRVDLKVGFIVTNCHWDANRGS